MPGMLQLEGIDADCYDEPGEEGRSDPVRVSGDAADEQKDPHKKATLAIRAARFPFRFRKEEIVVGAGENFTQFSSPSFLC
jgi:hypothetical protein